MRAGRPSAALTKGTPKKKGGGVGGGLQALRRPVERRSFDRRRAKKEKHRNEGGGGMAWHGRGQRDNETMKRRPKPNYCHPLFPTRLLSYITYLEQVVEQFGGGGQRGQRTADSSRGKWSGWEERRGRSNREPPYAPREKPKGEGGGRRGSATRRSLAKRKGLVSCFNGDLKRTEPIGRFSFRLPTYPAHHRAYIITL